MPKGQKPVWTTGRKLTGNILPLAIATPFLALGLKGYPTTGLSGATLVLLILFPIVGWLATNLLGNSGTWGVKAEMGKRYHHERPFDKTEKWLVGFARPGYKGLLDPHEDVGFLILHDDRVEFFGGKDRVELSKSEVTKTSYRPNPHSWLGLGRWVSLEGTSLGKPVRLLIEPRERATLLGNRALGAQIRDRIETWMK